MQYLISAVVGFLIGSFPTAYLLLKKSKGIDITNEGTGNVGAMNSFEVTNSKAIGIAVLIIDALKGILSCLLPVLFFQNNFALASIGLLFAVLAHCYNPWIGFKGGRGLATAAGGTFIIFPFLPITWGTVWVIIYLLRKDIVYANIWANFASLFITFTSVNIAVKYTSSPAGTDELMLFTAAIMILIFIKHIDPLKEVIKNKSYLSKGEKR